MKLTPLVNMKLIGLDLDEVQQDRRLFLLGWR